jgi:hypothetical protein
MSPVTATFPDRVVDAVTERRTDQLLDEIADLLDHGFHYSPITYPNPQPVCTDPDCPIVTEHNQHDLIKWDERAEPGHFYVINDRAHYHGGE